MRAGAGLEPAAALLERGYRMALLLQGRCGAASGDGAAETQVFERQALAEELLAVLDEARAALSRAAMELPLPPRGSGPG